MARIILSLNDTQLDYLNALIEYEGVQGEEVCTYLREAVASLDDIYKEELIAVKRELIEKASEITP